MDNTYEINSKYSNYSKSGSSEGNNTKENILNEKRQNQSPSSKGNDNGKS